MKEKSGMFSVAKCGLIILLFLMPFIKISCGGMLNISVTGMELVTGKTLDLNDRFSGKAQARKIDSEPYAVIAFGCAIAGLLIGFNKARVARFFNAICGAGGFVFMILLKNKLDKDVTTDIKEGVTLNYEFAFWGVVVLFLAMAVMSFLAFKKQGDSPGQQSVNTPSNTEIPPT